jgi:hypothetical protein
MNLTNQTTIRNQWRTTGNNAVSGCLSLLLPAWQKITLRRKKQIIQNDKFIVLSEAYRQWKYLDDNFFGAEARNGTRD